MVKKCDDLARWKHYDCIIEPIICSIYSLGIMNRVFYLIVE
jgi:hypothetical protein